MKNYRKFYEDVFGINIPKGYEIHHIDGDRQNNTIRNLVLLPKKLHNEYHTALFNVKYCFGNYGLALQINEGSLLSMQCAYIDKLSNVVSEAKEWMIRRDSNSYPKEWYKCQFLE